MLLFPCILFNLLNSPPRLPLAIAHTSDSALAHHARVTHIFIVLYCIVRSTPSSRPNNSCGGVA